MNSIMKFTVSSSVLLKSLNSINGVVATNPIVPILENFLFRINVDKESNATLTATASDLQTTMTTVIQVDATESGAIAIPAKLLLDTLRVLPEQPINVEIDLDVFSATINTDNGRFKLAGENPIDFPKLPVVNKTRSVELSADALLSAINSTAFATSTDDLRPAMTGVFVNFEPDKATFVGTDGHRLIRYTRTDIQTPAGVEGAVSPKSVIIPRKALQLLKNALNSGEQVTAGLGLGNASFTFGVTTLVCRLIDERFPDYQNAIPTHNPNILTIGRSDLLNTLKRIMIYANRTTHQIRISIKGKKLTISAEDLDYANEANESLLCDYEGEDLDIGFNAKLMIEMLNNLSAKMVNLEMSAPNRAGLIIPLDKDENEDILMLAMPVMLNTYATA